MDFLFQWEKKNSGFGNRVEKKTDMLEIEIHGDVPCLEMVNEPEDAFTPSNY